MAKESAPGKYQYLFCKQTYPRIYLPGELVSVPCVNIHSQPGILTRQTKIYLFIYLLFFYFDYPV